METENILLATTVCPHCKAAAARLTAEGIPFKEIFADKDPAGMKLARDNGVSTVPVMFVKNGTETRMLHNESEIYGYIREIKK